MQTAIFNRFVVRQYSPVRHLEFEKETAGHPLLQSALEAFQHSRLEPLAERSSSETQGQLELVVTTQYSRSTRYFLTAPWSPRMLTGWPEMSVIFRLQPNLQGIKLRVGDDRHFRLLKDMYETHMKSGTVEEEEGL